MAKLEDLVGSGAYTVTALEPTGMIDLFGVQREAYAQEQSIKADSPVIVVRADTSGLVVRVATPTEARTISKPIDKSVTQPSCDEAQPERGSRIRWHLMAGAVLGLIFGLILLGLRQTDGPPQRFDWLWIAYPIGGLLLGVIHVFFYRVIFSIAHEVLSEQIPAIPGIFTRIVLPLALGTLGFALGQLQGNDEALIGTLLGAFVLPLVLWMLAGLYTSSGWLCLLLNLIPMCLFDR